MFSSVSDLRYSLVHARTHTHMHIHIVRSAVYDIPGFAVSTVYYTPYSVLNAVYHTPYNAPVLRCQELSECRAEQLA